MVVHRCIACFQEYPHNAPAFCACGSTAFTMIVPEEAPTTSPDGGHRDRTRLLGNAEALNRYAFGQASSTAAASTSGPTPPPSSDSSPGSASAPQPGAADEPGDESDDVGGVDCMHCGSPATHSVESLEGTAYLCDVHAERVRSAGAPVHRLEGSGHG